MGLTRRKDSYYVEFPVMTDGTVWKHAPGVPGAKLKRWKTFSRNKQQAKVFESEIFSRLREGIPLTPVVESKLTTFGEYADKWLLASKGSLAPKTHSNYKQLLVLYVMPSLKDQLLASLTWGAIKALLTAKQQAGLSVNSIRLIRAVISTILTDAAEDGMITVNRVLGQRRKRRASQVSAPDVHPFSWEHKQAFEAKLETHGTGRITVAILRHAVRGLFKNRYATGRR